MAYTLRQAARASGKGKSTILRAIQAGKISAARDEASGGWTIDPAELHRVYPPAPNSTARSVPSGQSAGHNAPDELTGLRMRAEIAEARLADAQDTIADLRSRLDAEAEERRRLTMLLTDQSKPRRRWWQLGRRG